jgi:hypothetical protein
MHNHHGYGVEQADRQAHKRHKQQRAMCPSPHVLHLFRQQQFSACCVLQQQQETFHQSWEAALQGRQAGREAMHACNFQLS